jgi:hypothetical protein
MALESLYKQQRIAGLPGSVSVEIDLSVMIDVGASAVVTLDNVHLALESIAESAMRLNKSSVTASNLRIEYNGGSGVQAFDSNFTCARCVFTQDSKSYSTAEYQAAIEIVSSLLPTRALDSLAITDSSFYPGFDKGRGFRDVIIAATNISHVLIDSSTFHLHRYVGMYQRCIASHRIASHRIASRRIATAIKLLTRCTTRLVCSVIDQLHVDHQ